MFFLTCSWRFLGQLEFKLEKIWDSKTYKERQKNTFFDRNKLLKPNIKYKRLSGARGRGILCISTGAARAWTCRSTFAPTDFADDCLNTSRVKDTYVVAIKMTTNGQKMAICTHRFCGWLSEYQSCERYLCSCHKNDHKWSKNGHFCNLNFQGFFSYKSEKQICQKICVSSHKQSPFTTTINETSIIMSNFCQINLSNQKIK